MVYDISHGQSFANAAHWLQELRNYADEGITVMLVGNKSDLRHLRQVKREDATQFARTEGIAFIETSALDATHVSTAFETVLTEIYHRARKEGKDEHAETPVERGEEDVHLEKPPAAAGGGQGADGSKQASCCGTS